MHIMADLIFTNSNSFLWVVLHVKPHMIDGIFVLHTVIKCGNLIGKWEILHTMYSCGLWLPLYFVDKCLTATITSSSHRTGRSSKSSAVRQPIISEVILSTSFYIIVEKQIKLLILCYTELDFMWTSKNVWAIHENTSHYAWIAELE